MTPGLLDAPRGKGRVATLDLMRFVFAMWVVLMAHLLFWAAYDGQAFAGEGFARRLADVFQTGGETHPAVLGLIVLSGYCIHRAGFRRGTLDRSTLRTFAIRRSTRIALLFLRGRLQPLRLPRADRVPRRRRRTVVARGGGHRDRRGPRDVPGRRATRDAMGTEADAAGQDDGARTELTVGRAT
jgi:hypothetical protein